MELLFFLVERRGQLITREQIVERIWGKDVFLDTDNSINAAIRKIRQTLQDDPERPRFVQTVIGRGYRFIAIVEGAASAPTVEPQSSPGKPDAGTNERLSGSRSIRLSLFVGAGLLVILATLSSLSSERVRKRLFSRGDLEHSRPSQQARRSVAVLGFKNLTGREEEAWISTALAEMISVELATGQQLRLVPGESVARMKIDLALSPSDTYSVETLARIRKHLSNDVVVLGSYLALGKTSGEKIRVTLQVQDARSGETVAVVSEDGTETELAQVASRSGNSLRKALGIDMISAEGAAEIRQTLPQNAEAARFYSEGLAKLRNFDSLAARDFLLRAIDADPDHALSHAALSQCWSNLGYDQKAQEEAKKAFELSSKLRREEQLTIEGRYRVEAHEWQRAEAIYALLWEFFPDNTDYGLNLASVQTSAGLGKDAMNTVEKIRKMPLLAREDPRIDLVAAEAAQSMSDFKRQQQFAALAAEKGEAQSAGLMAAQAKLLEGIAFERSGETASAAASFNDAGAAFTKAGDRQSEAKSVLETGNLLYDEGDFNDARAKFEEALRIFRQVGSKRSTARALNDIGNVLYEQGELGEAQDYYQRALTIQREIGHKTGIASALGNIANVLDSMGRLSEAHTMQEQALSAFSDAGDKRGMASTLNNLGNLLDELGDLLGAADCFDRAVKLHAEIGHRRGSGFALSGWGLVLLEQDRLTQARSKMEEALALRKELAEQSTLAMSSLYLAQLSLEENRVSDAERLARDAATEFAKDKSAENETVAYATLARVLLAEQRTRDARDAADQAKTLSQKTKYLSPRFEATIALALVEGASGNTAEAERHLDHVITETRQLGFAGYELEARLERGLIEYKAGKKTGNEAYLESVRKDASTKGYRLIARKSQLHSFEGKTYREEAVNSR
jgi:tetratricopeptide (TPR) repeat protein/DNA-binding winged helix-turn-helix (wHTH) protein